ncbi:MAG: methyl-accepting chemotaxis protein [Clostridium sp.]|uniref:methyl-accepting chemotaxis protein n=1 Tax=Clostridium sp. TaxID=1506 RepID=UPI00290DFBB9|nr:methyl-accepting chemotaxis protein [Clostridium sp.]MDU5111775.1 methyl-accepting chemotaxis protein [Clostridium sp.]
MIKNISEEVNLLSINASIEAAMAGSNGNGFYVIAEEIRRLSEETDENLKEMKQTVSDVTNAFQEISCNSKELLEFLNSNVRKDYNILIDISSSYGTDMETLSEGAIKMDNITKSIFIYMNEICKSIEAITYSTNNILDNSKETNTEIKSIEKIVNGLGKSIEEENLLLSKLQISLKQFVI